MYGELDELDASFDRLLVESEDEVDIFGEVDDVVVPALWSSDDEFDEDFEPRQPQCTEWTSTIRENDNIKFIIKH
ncbi:hypothetical protein Y032_0008g123 [Ancylostoma ceylanicum]|uniref:Uncharacterized protein n=1 Tax=Ancylostoma ceylanicum TaxID=53326 RepID=A0A016VJT5_9BILA|nr:hypothetical protein Y032_0008g123 [Ancylostoma ceylanicum]